MLTMLVKRNCFYNRPLYSLNIDRLMSYVTGESTSEVKDWLTNKMYNKQIIFRKQNNFPSLY